MQFIENIEDESPANPENSLHHAFKTDRNESPQSTTRVGSGSLSLESMVSSGFLKFLIDKKVTYYSRLIYLYLAIYKLAENSTVASLDIKAAGENHKSAEAEDKDEDENEDEDMLFSVPMARKVIPKGTALKVPTSDPSYSLSNFPRNRIDHNFSSLFLSLPVLKTALAFQPHRKETCMIQHR